MFYLFISPPHGQELGEIKDFNVIKDLFLSLLQRNDESDDFCRKSFSFCTSVPEAAYSGKSYILTKAIYLIAEVATT